MMPASHSNFFKSATFGFFGVKWTPVGDFRHPIVPGCSPVRQKSANRLDLILTTTQPHCTQAKYSCLALPSCYLTDDSDI